MKYIGIIKRTITPTEYQEKTGIDLSHTDTSKIKCLEVREEAIIAPDRSSAFKALVQLLPSLKQPLSLTVIRA